MSDNKKQKLELTWIGKNNSEYDIANIEPRILEENPKLSNCVNDPNTDNMIIHGDNLLALKALLPEYEGKVKCVYIDPPYNTGNAFEYYDDSTEHSTWLSLIKPRLELLKKLLREDGVIFVSIDDNEQAYLKCLMDEVFLRNCFLNTVTLKTGESQRAIGGGENKKLRKKSEFLLIYSKTENGFNFNNVYEETDLKDILLDKAVDGKMYEYRKVLKNTGQKKLYKTISISGEGELPLYIHNNYEIKDIKYSIKNNLKIEDEVEKYINEARENFDVVFRTAVSQSSIFLKVKQITEKGLYSLDYRPRSGKNKGKTITRFFLDGNEIVFLKETAVLKNSKIIKKELLGNIWTDIKQQGIASEGFVEFKFSKKPERLLERIIRLSSSKNDVILDSFLGSGTTCAVANKMGRKYIGIEMGEHAYTHCKVRLDKVIEGTDQGGVSKSLEWKGGGAYKFYELAPSFIAKDQFGNPVIDRFYNDTKLIKAMCKLMNFTYKPSQTEYWKHGVGQGKNFLYITTQLLTSGMIQQIAGHLAEGESLIICPKKFEPGADKIDNRITIKKIPQSVLKACHFGKKEYLLPIKETAMEEIEFETEEENNE